jgi:hypothetical protein
MPVGGRAADCDWAIPGLLREAFLPREAYAAWLVAAGSDSSPQHGDGLAGAGSTAS